MSAAHLFLLLILVLLEPVPCLSELNSHKAGVVAVLRTNKLEDCQLNNCSSSNPCNRVLFSEQKSLCVLLYCPNATLCDPIIKELGTYINNAQHTESIPEKLFLPVITPRSPQSSPPSSSATNSSSADPIPPPAPEEQADDPHPLHNGAIVASDLPSSSNTSSPSQDGRQGEINPAQVQTVTSKFTPAPVAPETLMPTAVKVGPDGLGQSSEDGTAVNKTAPESNHEAAGTKTGKDRPPEVQMNKTTPESGQVATENKTGKDPPPGATMNKTTPESGLGATETKTGKDSPPEATTNKTATENGQGSPENKTGKDLPPEATMNKTTPESGQGATETKTGKDPPPEATMNKTTPESGQGATETKTGKDSPPEVTMNETAPESHPNLTSATPITSLLTTEGTTSTTIATTTSTTTTTIPTTTTLPTTAIVTPPPSTSISTPPPTPVIPTTSLRPPTTTASSSPPPPPPPINNVTSQQGQKLSPTPVKPSELPSAGEPSQPNAAGSERERTDHNLLEGAGEPLTNHLLNTGALLAVLIFGLLFFIVAVMLFLRHAYESYKRRDYTQVDYLINGMYSDSGV